MFYCRHVAQSIEINELQTIRGRNRESVLENLMTNVFRKVLKILRGKPVL